MRRNTPPGVSGQDSTLLGSEVSKMQHQRKRIAKIERARSSEYGNPAFYITFTDYERIKTAANAACAYSIGNKGMREGDDVEVFINGRGTISGMGPSAQAEGVR